MHTTKLTRLLSVFLVCVMAFSLFGSAFAVTGDGGDAAPGATGGNTGGSGDSGLDAQSDAVTYYVANAASGGTEAGTGTEASPFLRLTQAFDAITNGAIDEAVIVLKSDITLTNELDLSGVACNLTIKSADGKRFKIQYTGDRSIGNNSGVLKVAGNWTVLSLENIEVHGPTGEFEGRAIYVSDGGIVNLTDTTIYRGKMVSATNVNLGGAGVCVATDGTLNVGSNTKFELNNANKANGGAIFVAERGTVKIAGENIQIKKNYALNGAGIFLDEGAIFSMNGQAASEDADGVVFTNNAATEHGGAMYVSVGADAKVCGKVSADGHTIGGNAENIYLERDATLDINEATLWSNLGITCEDPHAYRLVSNQVDDYQIATEPAATADEKFWKEDAGVWDIRYMVYNGVPGLYLYYFTVDAIFGDINTLVDVTGPALNGDIIDYLERTVPNTSLDDEGNLTVPEIVPKSGDDYVINFTTNEKGEVPQYRIPTPDQVVISTGDRTLVEGTDYTYEPNYEEGTAKITVNGDVVNSLTEALKFLISGERYHFLTVRMEGPLYDIVPGEKNITGQTDATAKFTQSEKSGTTATYTVTRNNKPLTADGKWITTAKIDLYKENEDTPVASVELDANGKAVFNGLEETSTYYPILVVNTIYRVIERDVLDMNLSTLAGQTLATDCNFDPSEVSVTYSAASKTAQISKVVADATVVFKVNQAAATITFHSNKPLDIFGEVTKGRDTLTLDGSTSSDTISKVMEQSAVTYGTLAEATLEGYDFVGWFTEKAGGQQITEDTPFGHESEKDLYAHWVARNDTAYTVKHWVEVSDGGANPGYEPGVTDTKTDNGVLYYLYETTTDNDGTSDILLANISDKDLKQMESAEYDWWTRDGFTARFPENPKVEADGSAIFDIFYDRNRYEITFVNNENPEQTFPNKEVPYGAVIGELPEPTRPGYEFDDHMQGGWEDENGARVNPTDIYIWAHDKTLTATWNAKDDTEWAIVVMVQDISNDKKTGLNAYTKIKSVLIDNDGNSLTGTSDTTVTKNINDFNSLTTDDEMVGYHYIGYNDNGAKSPAALSTGDNEGDFSVYVKATDKKTADAQGYLSADFDGGIVYLYFDRNTRLVKFEDGLGNPVDETTIIYGGNFSGQFPDDPGRDGYDFTGWQDPDGDPITDDTPASKYTQEDGALIVVPIWVVRTYNLTYIPGDNATFIPSEGTTEKVEQTANGGYIDPNKVTYGEPIGVMPTANKPGYDFEGWHINGVTGVKATSDTIVNTDSVIIRNATASYEETTPLYAGYIPHTYTVVLHPGSKTVAGNVVNGTVDPERITVTFGEKVSGLPTPVLEGYKFISWALDPLAPSTKVSNGVTWTHPATNGAEVHLYAIWVPSTYTYTFNLNDNIGSTRAVLADTTIDYIELEYGSVYGKAFEVEAVRDGYNFMGWSLTADGNVLSSDDIVKIATDATLFAIWEPKVYSVRLILNGSVIDDPSKGDYLKTYGMMATYDSITDTWVVPVIFDTTYGNLPTPTKDNCKFNGWLADAKNWAEINNKLIFKLDSYTDYKDKDGIALTAIMEPYFTFIPNPGEFDDGVTDSKVILQSDLGDKLPTVIKVGFDFQGWEDKDGNSFTLEDLKNADKPMTLRPILVPIVTLDANGGTVNGEKISQVAINKISSLPIPVRPGFSFDCWVDENGDPTVYDDIRDSKEPVSLTAKWIVNAIFNGNGGTVEGKNVIEKVASRLKVLPVPDERENYLFNGWFTAKWGGTKVNVATLKNINDPVTVYAQWTYQPPVYMVQFDSDGGTDVPNQAITEGEYAKNPGAPTKVNHKFLGWFLGDEEFNFKKTAITGDMTLVAKWEEVGAATNFTGNHILYINGYPDGTVRPEADITRAEVAAIFYRLLKDDIRSKNLSTSNSFSDVTSDAWFNKEVSTLAKMGIIEGKGSGIFDPNAPITRAEFATVCARFDNLEGGTRSFKDVSKTHWAYKYITSAAEKGWVEGYSDNTFRPENSITRAEVVTIVNRMLGRNTITLDTIISSGMKRWPDNTDTSVWYYLDMQEATNAHDHEFKNGVEHWTEIIK